LRGNVPFSEVIDWILGLAPQGIVEFIPGDDPMIHQLLAGRDLKLFADYSEETLRTVIARRHRIVNEIELSDRGRILIHYASVLADDLKLFADRRSVDRHPGWRRRAFIAGDRIPALGPRGLRDLRCRRDSRDRSGVVRSGFKHQVGYSDLARDHVLRRGVFLRWPSASRSSS
jgi:hypothetical protein